MKNKKMDVLSKMRLIKDLSWVWRKKRRGQLNIIEVVLAASIILVLSVSIAQVGIKIAESNKQEQTSILTSIPGEILRESDHLGFLRPFIYLDNSVNLQVYLDEAISPGTYYWVYELGGNCLKNSQLDCTELDSVLLDTYSSTLYLSGYLTNNTATIAIITLSSSL
ncbi:MAG: hypothetical protein ACXACX_15960 [Candidatus Hodarchaeales archaeon]|jgi:hypothetical protein